MFVRTTVSRGYRSLTRSTSRPFFNPVQTTTPFSRLPSRSFAVAMADSASTSGVTADGLKEKLSAQLGAQFVEIEDMSGGCGQAFQAIIVSPQFDKKNMLARHRLVNSVLKDEIAAIHAWTPKCYTPEQWQKLQEERS
ncbi:BolA domain protein [Talaromyces stipitatus ATCC 10500]|uniref:BolA domain protein n=1 Tax=Talaromyces stipitatus (strain ATCC 10500 / CBS 375.48 / QM 6759 / NRRL 1006) TaxID=441959 RepID=B8MCW8_TALSN|nr:BolA domain protein [Talaromyces stipitatus ATCC 10500]EED17494.1 BolA domain protein [Talaromyces stipitatus ATCC 10500]